MAQISLRAATIAGAVGLVAVALVAVAGPQFSKPLFGARPAHAQDTNNAVTAPATPPATPPTTPPATGDSAAPNTPPNTPPATGDSAAPAAGSDQGAAPAPADPKEVVATIDGKPITRQDVIDSAADLPPQYQAQIDRIFPQLLNRLIGAQLLVAKGRKDGLADDPQVKHFVEQAEDQAITQLYLQKVVEKTVTDDAIKQRYDADLAKHPPEIEIRASHILVKTEDEAKEIIKQLQGGADFAKLAAEKSVDTESAKSGGDLNWFTKETMVKEFSDAAFAMQRGDVSKVPVKSQFGWHIIKITDSRIQTPVPLEQRKDDIRKALSQDAVHAEVQGLIGKAQVQYTKDDYKLPLAPIGQ